MAEGIQIKNLPSTTTIKQGDTMTIVQDKQNKQLTLDGFFNKSDLATLSPLENRCDEVKNKIEVDEYSAEITTSQSMSKIGSDDSGANLHENVLDGAFESCVLKGHTKYRDIDTGEILENFEESRNLELITVRMPILHTVGKNLFDYLDNEKLCVYAGGDVRNEDHTVHYTIQQSTVNVTGQGAYSNLLGYKLPLKHTESITISATGLGTTLYYRYYGEDFKTLSSQSQRTKDYVTTNNVKSVTIPFSEYPSQAEYIFLGIGDTTKSDYVIDNLQIEYGESITSYEPHKSNILSFNQKDDKTIVLRSLPDGTCDTLNVETGEYVQKIGERNYQDGDTNSNTLVTDGTKTQYKLSSPIMTKVDVQGFPHAYANGHIQLTSGSIEPSLTPTVTYKVPVSRMGQIASNTKSNLRQSIKLDQLEVLVYQSLINAEYENLLVQNSAESATSFRNLSVNDPKDGLYYMLKHLIEENQPVQNMLDKINLFYLYGLLSDEHYFDLLLGGEEDVY